MSFSKSPKKTAAPINIKYMILGKPLNEDMNLRPIKYQWAYDLYNQAVANTWFPHEIALGEDLDDWRKMDDDEKNAVSFLMSFFLVNNRR